MVYIQLSIKVTVIHMALISKVTSGSSNCMIKASLWFIAIEGEYSFTRTKIVVAASYIKVVT